MKLKKIILILLLFVGLISFTSCNDSMKTDEDISTADIEKIDNELSFYLSFDEEDSKTVKESISNNEYEVEYVFNEAVYKENVYAKRSNGVSNKALLFDGYSTFIEVNDFKMPESDFTVDLWLAPRGYETRTDNKKISIFSNSGNSGGHELLLGNYGKLTYIINTTIGSYTIVDDDLTLNLYEWNNITIVYKSGDNNTLFIYKNCELIVEYNLKKARPHASNASLLIGESKKPAMLDDVFTCNRYAGLIDEFKVYKTALNSAIIKKQYESKDSTIDVYEDLWFDEDLLADDRYFPQYHLRTSQNWANEFYGMFYYNGKYHAFFQQNVMGPYYISGQRWGHAISDDLVNWKILTPALLPEDNLIDENDIFSGASILNDKGEPVLFYTGVNYDDQYINKISLARPADTTDPNLTKWTKLGKTIVSQGNLSTRDNFRDPFIYKENGQYFMLVGGTDSATNNGAIFCYKAKNASLDSWEYLGVTYSGNRNKYSFLGNCYELPNLFKVYNKDKTQSKYVMMISPIQGSRNGVYYMTGDFDLKTGKFTPDNEEFQLYDYSPTSQTLCPAGFYDEKTDRNLFMTMSRTGYDSTAGAQERYDSGWSSVQTLFKEMYLDDNGELRFKVIDEYKNYYDETLIDLKDQNLSFDEVNEKIKHIGDDMLAIKVTIHPNQDQKVGLYVKYDHSGSEKVLVSYDVSKKLFAVDNSKSSMSMNNNGSGSGKVEVNGGLITFTIYVDRAMVESYINDEKQITTFGYNTSKTANGIKMYSSGNSARVVNLEIYNMHSSTKHDIDAYWK